MGFKTRRALMSASIPISRFISSIHMPYSHKLITTKDYYVIKELIQPGDILLSHIRGEFANMLIPGFWSHGAIYTGDLGQYPETVVEAVTSGTNDDQDLRGFISSKDYVWVLRPLFANKEERISAAKWAQSKIGAPYDWMFEYTQSNNKAFYCFELVGAAYDAILKPSPFQPRDFMDVPTFTGEDFLAAKKLFEPIWCNPPTREIHDESGVKPRPD